eukprot:SAG31_NODE_398_length_16250_cov_8.737601_9_plen_109_part_00
MPPTVGRALAAVDQAMESYSADLHEIDALQVGFHSDGRLPAAPPFHGYGTAHVSSSTHDTAAQSNRQRAAAVREQLGAGIAKRQQVCKLPMWSKDSGCKKVDYFVHCQ